MLVVFAPAVDDFCDLKPQNTEAMLNAEAESDSPDSAPPNPSEFGEQSTMKLDVENLTPEAHEALVECLRIAARRGRMLREAREREQAAASAEPLKDTAMKETSEQTGLGNQSPPCGDAQRNISDSDSG